MPASLFPDMDRNNSGLEDQRALQLAFELSMLGLSDASTTTEHETLNTTFADEARGKKSQNMTECVPVPSSEHVAEIVGRQGCKIKALRAKTNTYIKTPVRGEEPVFVVTGRKEDVAKAKREILSAAEHFSQIRASRKSTLGGGGVGGVGGGVGTGGGTVPGPPANVPGHVTIQVRVPYRVVGLVVGPKGATIKRIQHQTHTYIVTPSRDKEPVFEVTGLPESVEAARKEIEAHIAVRTGGGVGGGAVPCGGGGPADFAVDDAVDVGRGGMVGEEILASLYKNGLGFLYPNIKACNDLASRVCGKLGRSGDGSPFARAPPDVAFPSSLLDSTPLDSVLFPSEFSSSLSGGGSSSSSSSSSSSTSGGITATSGNFGTSGTPWGGLDRDEGLGESPSFEGPPSGPWSDLKSGNAGRFSPTIVNGTEPTSPHLPARRVGSDPLGVTAVGTSVSPTDSVGSLASIGSGGAAPGGGRRECVVCCEREVVAALVPCGHNLFCMECGQRVCSRADAHCPVCQHPVKQAIRIFS